MGACMSVSDQGHEATLAVNDRQSNVTSGELACLANQQNTMFNKTSLSISCKNLIKMDTFSDSDPFVVVYQNVNGQWSEIGRTEAIIDNHDPVFVRHIDLLYYFETIQKLKFRVFDVDTSNTETSHLKLEDQDFLGEAECTLAEIVNSINGKQIKLTGLGSKSQGVIRIESEELEEESGRVTLNLNMEALVGKRSSLEPFYMLKKSKENSTVLIYKSEVQHKTVSPRFTPVTIDTFTLCNNDMNLPITLEVYDWTRGGKHKFIGEAQFNINDIMKDKTSIIIKNPEDNKTTPRGTVYIDQCQYQATPSFLKYIQNGLELNFMVSIDFTGSNGDPRSASSLHYISRDGQLNSYEKAILSVGNVLEFYDKDKMFPVFGFGGTPANGQGRVSHCFALNGNMSNPDVYGINGILDIYKRSIKTTGLSGPTLFEPTILKAIDYCEECKHAQNKYMVLLIITDGEIHDMEKTIRAIVEGSTLPLSIIIVGVGHADFNSMEVLDGDDERLSYNGVKAERDIVQFVPIEELTDKSAINIAKELLSEIPSQVCDYLYQHHVSPELVRSHTPYMSSDSTIPPQAIPVGMNNSLPQAIPVAINNSLPQAVPVGMNSSLPQAIPVGMNNSLPQAIPTQPQNY